MEILLFIAYIVLLIRYKPDQAKNLGLSIHLAWLFLGIVLIGNCIAFISQLFQ